MLTGTGRFMAVRVYARSGPMKLSWSWVWTTGSRYGMPASHRTDWLRGVCTTVPQLHTNKDSVYSAQCYTITPRTDFKAQCADSVQSGQGFIFGEQHTYNLYTFIPTSLVL